MVMTEYKFVEHRDPTEYEDRCLTLFDMYLAEALWTNAANPFPYAFGKTKEQLFKEFGR